MRQRHLPLAVLCSLVILGVSASAEGPEKPAATPVLEGVLKAHPKFLYEYYLTTDAGQTCALFEAEGRVGELLSTVKPGSRVRVTGQLDTRLHPGGTEGNPSPFGRTWYIYMAVEKLDVLDAAPAAG